MAIGSGIFNPINDSLPLLAKIFQAFQRRVFTSFVRYFRPDRLLGLHRGPPPTRKPPSRRQPASGLMEASSVGLDRKEPINVAEVVVPSMEDWKVIRTVDQVDRRIRRFHELEFDELEFDVLELDRILDRLCIDRDSFGFHELRRMMLENGDVALTGQIPSTQLHDGTGLMLEEVGRQLGQLGLVAVSVFNPTNGDCFYIGKNAVMEESKLKRRISMKVDLTAIVRVINLQAHKAETEVELWQKSTLICQMSVQYDIYSSWQEVLPNLEHNL